MTENEKIEKLEEVIEVLTMALEVLKDNQTESNEEPPWWYDKDQVDPRL